MTTHRMKLAQRVLDSLEQQHEAHEEMLSVFPPILPEHILAARLNTLTERIERARRAVALMEGLEDNPEIHP